eukprot:m.5145 g.5145  ORF g.5145 m.5145 type:complete len:529 (-) comp2345_c0_seq1:348-1934(-)
MGSSSSLPVVKERELSCFVGTWNLGNKAPAHMNWIPIEEKHDIYVLGVQEAAFSKEGSKIDLFFEAMLGNIFDTNYVCLGYESLTPRTDSTFKQVNAFKDAVMKGTAKASGIRIVAFMKKSLAEMDHSIHVESYIQTCGRLQGASGNKGAVALVVHIDGARLAFVNNHLNAHMEQLERRIDDYEIISRRLHHAHDTFGDEKQKMTEQDDMEYSVEVMNKNDVVFWFGDVNMRLQPLEDLEQRKEMCDIVLGLIREKKFSELIKHDQLKKLQMRGIMLSGFEEGKIDFVPSFKFNAIKDGSGDGTEKSGLKRVQENPHVYDHQDNQHEKLNYNTKRVPSYCDRILWKKTEGVSIHCTKYTSHKFLQGSDHLPVYGTYKIKMRMLNGKKHQAVSGGFLKMHMTNVELNPHGSPSLLTTKEFKSAPISVTVFHKYSQHNLVLPANSNDDRVWVGDYILESTRSIAEAMAHPVLFLVRDYTKDDEDDVHLRYFGEGMLSLLNLTSRTVNIQLYQGGKPHGSLSAEVFFSVTI